MQAIRIGTRGSQLALWQATHIEGLLRKAHPQLNFERVIIKTEGDRDQKSSLTQIGGQGVFTKTIEEALLQNRIDIAVHSLKDLPSGMTEGLALGAVPQRGPVEDVLVTKDGKSFKELRSGARVASGSIRRRSQLMRLRPDLQMTDLRGNIDTRLKKLNEQDLDGIIMARAAIVRLNLDSVKYYTFTPEEMVPGVGQGAIGIQIRTDDETVLPLMACLNHPPTFAAVTAERSFLHELDSGCQFPVGGYARIEDDKLVFSGIVSSEDGKTILEDHIESKTEAAAEAGRELARRLIDKGAMNLIRSEE